MQEFCRWAGLLFLKNKKTDIQMMKNKWKITAAAILGTAGILTAGYLYWCTTLDDKVIWKDVSINWVALQGKTIEAAEKAVQEQFKKDYQDSEITVSLAEKNYEVKISGSFL